MKAIIPLIYLCLAIGVDGRINAIPSFLKICHRSDPKLNECVKKSVEALKPYIKKGIPEFKIPSCEPLVIPEVVLAQGKGAVRIKSVYRNISVFGPSEFVLKSVKIDKDKNRAKIRIFIPHLYMVSRYAMSGRILMMPISGEGVCTGNYTDVSAAITVQGELIDRAGEKYFNIRDFAVDFDIGHARIQLSDLFGGNKELGEAMNLFLNDNWKCIVREIQPVLEDTLANIFKNFSNKIYHLFPINKLLPP